MLVLIYSFQKLNAIWMQLFISTLEVISWKRKVYKSIGKQKKAFRNLDFGTFITDQTFASNQNWSREK